MFGLVFSTQNRRDVVSEVLANRGGAFEAKLLITPNVDHIVTLHSNREYRRACEGAWKLTVDGFPVEKLLRLLGVRIPERVTGADLFPAIMAGLDPAVHRPAFLVATELTRDFLRRWLLERGFSPERTFVAVPPFGFERDDRETARLLEAIGGLEATHLFMGVGAPKSEIWAHSHAGQLRGVCILCFGAGIEFFSGNLKRAPEWMQRNGFEWAWRLASEPRRLARRYLVNSWKFFYYAAAECCRHLFGRAA